MRAVVQRVSRAAVRVGGAVVGAIDRGLLVLVGFSRGDGEGDLEWMARKLLELRIFPDEEGRMNRSVTDVGGSLLLVSQFTLCADVGKGTRPSFGRAMEPAAAETLFQALVERVRQEAHVETGRFGAHMEVELLNDGPVTLWLSTEERGGMGAGS